MWKRLNLKKNTRYIVQSLPLVGIVIGSSLPITVLGRQLLILALLVWFQVYFVFDIFFTNGN